MIIIPKFLSHHQIVVRHLLITRSLCLYVHRSIPEYINWGHLIVLAIIVHFKLTVAAK